MARNKCAVSAKPLPLSKTVERRVALYISLLYAGISRPLSTNSFPTTIHVFPNPVTELLRIESQNESITNILIFDCVGKQIHITIKLQPHLMEIDFAEIPIGIYVAKVFFGKGCSVFKINRILRRDHAISLSIKATIHLIS